MPPEDIFPPVAAGEPPAPASAHPTKATGYHNCDFCDCRLTAGGEVMTLGDRAKKFQKLERINEEQAESLAKVEKECATLRAENATLKGEKPARSGGGVLGFGD